MKKLVVGSIVTATFLLVGCGGGSNSNDNSNNSNGTSASVDTSTNTQKTGTGYYVDDAVNGVNYKCGSHEGTTDENGTFTFENGKNCTFSLGGLKLREVNASSLDNNVSILEDNPTVAQLLQTLDKDGNASNGIQIPPKAGQIVRDELTSLDKPLDRDLLEALHDAIRVEAQNDYHGRVVDMNETQRHLNQTKHRLEQEGRRTQYEVEAQHRGSGRFSGDNNGTMNVGEEGHGRGNFSDNNGTMPTEEEREAHRENMVGDNNGTILTQEEREAHRRDMVSDNNGTMNGGKKEHSNTETSNSDTNNNEAMNGGKKEHSNTETSNSGTNNNNEAMNEGKKEHSSAETSNSGESDSSATGKKESSSNNQNRNGSGSSQGRARR